jgi:hypothetical protein
MAATFTHTTAWRRTLLALVATAFALMAIAAGGASSAQAWYCSPTGNPPFQHDTHWHVPYQHRYMSGHDHSNGEHHHVWQVWKFENYIQEMHINCV